MDKILVKEKLKRLIVLSLCYFLSFELTLLIKMKLNLSTVESIALVGLIFSFNPFDFYASKDDLINIFYSGSFLAMANAEIFSKTHWIIFTSILAGLIYKKSREMFVGFGGRLGTITFISSSLSIFLHFIGSLI